MRSKKSRGSEESDVDITPMIDIVFIMLIFFIVTASFAKESAVEVDRPNSSKTPPKSDKVSILVEIDANNRIWVDRREVDVRRVQSSLEPLRAKDPEAGVVIRAARTSKNGLLVRVVDAARLAGAPSVALAPRDD